MNEQVLLALTTEHTALQAARGSTIFDSTGRATLYLSTVASAVVALAFIGQTSRIGTPFFLFALTALPTLFFLGIVTYLRLLASAVEDMFYARAINRIRHAYLTLDAETSRYFLLSDRDDMAGVFANAGIVRVRWHLLSHTASLVLIINGVIGGVFAALLVEVVFDATTIIETLVGIVGTLMAGSMGLWHQHQQWNAAVATMPVAFSSEPTVQHMPDDTDMEKSPL